MNSPSKPKIAWITGASSGIGARLAEKMTAAGWVVAISARRGELLAQMAAKNPQLKPYPLDVTDAAAVAATVARIEAEQGAIDCAVLNAGSYLRDNAFTLTNQHVQDFLSLNVMGVVHGVTALLPGMKARGHGQLAIVSSVAGYRGLPASIAYSASKAALIAMAESLRLDCTPAGIKVQVINPGFVKTPLTDKNDFVMPMIIDADEAAAIILRELASDKFEIAFPWLFVRLMKMLRSMPHWLYFRLAAMARPDKA